MNELEILGKLSDAAGKEKVPQMDVTNRVLATLRDREAEAAVRPLAWIAGCAAAAAVPAAVLGVQAIQLWTDPLFAFFPVFHWVML